MHKALYILVAVAVAIASVSGYPYPYPGDDDDDVINIDISYLGQAAFRQPSQATGDKVSRWTPESRVNPEELGDLAEGDMRFDAHMGRNGVTDSALRWPKGIVPYTIDPGFDAKGRETIMKAIGHIHKLSCIRFVPRTNEQDYIAFVPKNTGCWSHVGKIGGMQEVNLQIPGCTSLPGTAVHEILHALGFQHQQSDYQRDDYVSIMTRNIKPGEEYNFNKAAKGTTTDFGVGYDYHSVMHYGEYAFSVNNQPTIVPKKKGVQIGQRDGMSRGDVDKLNAMYKCSKKLPTAGWTGNVYTGEKK